MVPGAGVARNGKRKAEHERHASASKKAMEAYYGQAGGHGRVATGGGRSSDNSGEEATDDESEFSSVDGRTSPSQQQQPGAVGWGAPPPHAGMAGHFSTEAHGFAAAAAAGLSMPAHAIQQQVVDGASSSLGSAGVSNNNNCWSAYGGVGGAGHQSRQQQAQLEQQFHQQQQLMYQQQQQQQQQVDVRRARPEGDEWGWFVDAGEQEQQAHPGQWGVRRSAQH